MKESRLENKLDIEMEGKLKHEQKNFLNKNIKKIGDFSTMKTTLTETLKSKKFLN